MMATSTAQHLQPYHPHHPSTADSSASAAHRRTLSYDLNPLAAQHSDQYEESNGIPLTDYARTAAAAGTSPRAGPLQTQAGPHDRATSSGGSRVGRSLSLFRRQSRRSPGQVYTQGTVPPVPQTPILQYSGASASRLLRLEDPILIRIAHHFDINDLLLFSHLSKRCRAITAKTLTLALQRTILKVTLCQERKAVFSLEFIFQHFDPASLQAVFRASQLKSRRYFENSALARPVVHALTLVTPNGAHHPIFRLGGFDPHAPDAADAMTERDLERATTLLARPFQLDIRDRGYYRVSPTTSCLVDTPFFPSQPLLDPLVPMAIEGAVNGPPTWEMMYKVDLQPPNYPQRVQQQQEKILQERARLNHPPPLHSGAVPVASGLPPANVFTPLPDIKTGPNLQVVLPDSLDSKTSKGATGLRRKPTVVRPPPEGWGPLPPVAPPPSVPASMAYQLGARTVNPNVNESQPVPVTPTGGVSMGVGASAIGHSNAPMESSCMEPELAEETERFLTLLFIQFPIQTLFPFTVSASRRASGGGLVSGWMSKSKLGRSLTLKKNQGHQRSGGAGGSVDLGRQVYVPMDQP